MKLISIEKKATIAPLFQDWDETMIWSALQGYMGEIWGNNQEKSTTGAIVIGDFIFLAGEVDKVFLKALKKNYEVREYLIVPQHDEWFKIIEEIYEGKFEQVMRYAIKKEANIFDKHLLMSYIHSMDKRFELKKIDKEIYDQIKSEEWCKDLCGQFSGYQEYVAYGLGYVLMEEGKVVSGASSYTVYDQGIEIQIDTHEQYRRQGLALVCASQLILACLDKGLYPSWDAANLASVALAEKLGYHLDKEYVTYHIT